MSGVTLNSNIFALASTATAPAGSHEGGSDGSGFAEILNVMDRGGGAESRDPSTSATTPARPGTPPARSATPIRAPANSGDPAPTRLTLGFTVASAASSAAPAAPAPEAAAANGAAAPSSIHATVATLGYGAVALATPAAAAPRVATPPEAAGNPAASRRARITAAGAGFPQASKALSAAPAVVAWSVADRSAVASVAVAAATPARNTRTTVDPSLATSAAGAAPSPAVVSQIGADFSVVPLSSAKVIPADAPAAAVATAASLVSPTVATRTRAEPFAAARAPADSPFETRFSPASKLLTATGGSTEATPRVAPTRAVAAGPSAAANGAAAESALGAASNATPAILPRPPGVPVAARSSTTLPAPLVATAPSWTRVLATESPASGLRLPTSAAPRGVEAPSIPWSAPPPLSGPPAATPTIAPSQAPAADSAGGSAAWDLSGAVPLQDLLRSDPMLGLQSLQPRTHLAVANAVPIRASGVDRRSPPTSGAAPTSAGPGAAPATLASAAPAATTATGIDARGERRGFAAAKAPSDTGASAKPASAAAIIGSSPDMSGADSVPPEIGPVTVTQLPDLVADQASDLLASNNPATATPTAPRAVKELEIKLEPPDLGAISLRLRLTNGKLSIVIGVSNSTTLAAIENERGAIADRIGAAQLSPSDLLIQPQAGPSSNFESRDAADANASQFTANGQPNESPRGESGQANGRDPPRQERAPTRGDFGDLIV